MTGKMTRVKLVLFDAFDTLITPRLPIHIQYAEEARKAGLDVDPDVVRAAFKSAFNATTLSFPEWGRRQSPPMTPEEWWLQMIRSTMVGSGIKEEAVDATMPILGPTLLRRFESREGYRSFDDVIPALTALKEMNVKTGVVSNADSRILRTFSALSITPLLTAPTTLSQCCGYEKPDERIFRLAVSRSAIDEDIAEHGGKGEVREDVIFVGDELEADYYGATSAGLSARLLRRPGEWSDGAKRNAEDEEAVVEMGVNVVRSLDSLVQEIRSRNGGVEV